MKVAMPTRDVDDNTRRIIKWYYERTENPMTCPLATREECRQFYKSYGDSIMDDAGYEFTQACEAYEERN